MTEIVFEQVRKKKVNHPNLTSNMVVRSVFFGEPWNIFVSQTSTTIFVNDYEFGKSYNLVNVLPTDSFHCLTKFSESPPTIISNYQDHESSVFCHVSFESGKGEVLSQINVGTKSAYDVEGLGNGYFAAFLWKEAAVGIFKCVDQSISSVSRIKIQGIGHSDTWLHRIRASKLYPNVLYTNSDDRQNKPVVQVNYVKKMITKKYHTDDDENTRSVDCFVKCGKEYVCTGKQISYDERLLIFDAETTLLIFNVECLETDRTNRSLYCVFAFKNRYILTGDGSGQIEIWDMNSGENVYGQGEEIKRIGASHTILDRRGWIHDITPLRCNRNYCEFLVSAEYDQIVVLRVKGLEMPEEELSAVALQDLEERVRYLQEGGRGYIFDEDSSRFFIELKFGDSSSFHFSRFLVL